MQFSNEHPVYIYVLTYDMKHLQTYSFLSHRLYNCADCANKQIFMKIILLSFCSLGFKYNTFCIYVYVCRLPLIYAENVDTNIHK